MILSYFHWIIRCSLNHLKSCQRTWSSGFTHTLVLWNSMYIFQFFNYECKEKGKGSGVWPSMVTHTQNLCSAFNPSKCTHTVVNTHTPWTHTRSSGQPMLRCPGSSWGSGALLKGLTSVMVLKVERVLVIHSPPPTIPAGPETRTHNLQVTSPTLYPLGHDCPYAIKVMII